MQASRSLLQVTNNNIVDLLCTNPSQLDFSHRISRLQLTSHLEQKIQDCHEQSLYKTDLQEITLTLNSDEETELAQEVLYYRHRFSQCILKNQTFSQAALTVIQNSYLFRNRHIFLAPDTDNIEQERQLALKIFSEGPQAHRKVLPLKYTLRHPTLARIWSRIIGTLSDEEQLSPAFLELHSIVESLNTLRNIYILFFTRLIRKLSGAINPVYKQSITYEDSIQIGTFGIARAAYRYHPSSGVRFSTYAAKWFYKEIQRQAISGRLVPLSSNRIEKYSKAAKQNKSLEIRQCNNNLLFDAQLGFKNDISELQSIQERQESERTPEELITSREQHQNLFRAIDSILADRTSDILKRRYGLPPYNCNPHSLLEIANHYKVTKGRIHQIIQQALVKLKEEMCQPAEIS